MKNYGAMLDNLSWRGYEIKHFSTAQEAADYLDGQIHQSSVAFGGSVTIEELGLYSRLSSHNEVISHWNGKAPEAGMHTEVYISSVNGMAETGEIINIDGTGNRVASTIFGHKRVYLVIGSNKIAPDYESALWRARNISAPKNAQRLGKKTPCAIHADRCYDCKSPERICRALTVLWERPKGIEHMELIFVDQELGY